MKRLLLISAFSFPLSAFPAVSAGDATNAVVGEAAGAPYIVKLGVAAAIRNRDSLRGVYGFHAKHNATEPEWVWQDAARAWLQSVTNDPTHGAVNFGCKADVDKGTFKGLHLTAVLGKGRHATYFFK
ncbi:MAG: hypothetical protein KGL39_36885 [Patescibacteria group bacterium]|nr:hypothetical protein [Patescibacteria group bacterium]